MIQNWPVNDPKLACEKLYVDDMKGEKDAPKIKDQINKESNGFIRFMF